MTSIQNIWVQVRLAPSERHNCLKVMTAPTSRGFGDGRDDRGRAPFGVESGPDFYIVFALTKINILSRLFGKSAGCPSNELKPARSPSSGKSAQRKPAWRQPRQ